MAETNDVQGARWSKFISVEGQFLDNGNPSGAAGSVFVGTLSLDNFPNAMIAIRTSFSLGIDNNEVVSAPGLYTALQQIAEDCTITVNFAQQSLTDNRCDLRNFQGSWGNLRPLPLPLPHYLRGANQCRVEIVRTATMPTVGEALVVPTVKVALVGVSIMSDLAPGGSPGSTGYR